MKAKTILSFLLGKKKTKGYKVDLKQTLSDKVTKIEYHFTNLNFSNFYKFCIGWCFITLAYFSVQGYIEKSPKWNYLIFLSSISFIFYFFLLRFYQEADLYKTKLVHKVLIVLSAWLLCFIQYLFITTSFYSDVAGLHTVSGVVYGLFISLFYFLPTWYITVLSSLGALFFLSLHYYGNMGAYWYFSGQSGNINAFYIYQLVIEFIFVIGFISYANKRREEKHKDLQEVFLKKLISNPHIKMMDAFENKTQIGNWLFDSRTIFSDKISGADLILYEKAPNGDLYVAIGDIIGHGLDVSSGSFIASTVIRSLASTNTHPRKIFDVVNNVLHRLTQEEGGELFLQLLVCKDNGEINIYGSPAGETKINDEEINVLYVILGKELDYFTKENIVIRPYTTTMKKNHILFSCTDGWKFKDLRDDRSYIRLEYVGDN